MGEKIPPMYRMDLEHERRKKGKEHENGGKGRRFAKGAKGSRK
jgi:hypothetical protein